VIFRSGVPDPAPIGTKRNAARYRAEAIDRNQESRTKGGINFRCRNVDTVGMPVMSALVSGSQRRTS
jgi:hypothetical protein